MDEILWAVIVVTVTLLLVLPGDVADAVKRGDHR
jgi:hypothetical protein